MQRTTIEERVKVIFAQEMDKDVEDISSATEFAGDSLEHVELIMCMEEAFEVEIPDEKAETLKTVEQFTAYFRKALG